MLSKIDALLNRITMYRLTYYGLGIMAVVAVGLSIFGKLAFSYGELVTSLAILLVACRLTNEGLKRLFSANVTLESTPITALILFFILLPPTSTGEAITIALTGVVAIAAKYFLAWRRYHLFNPAALGVVVLSLAGSGLAGWWVATPWLVPVTALIGLAVVRKLRRFTMVGVFLLVAAAAIIVSQAVSGTLSSATPLSLVTSFPLIFLASFMLTEPSSMPARHSLRLIYAAIVGILVGTNLELGFIAVSPALALLIGNLFSYIASRRARWRMKLQNLRALTPQTYELAFATESPVSFKPGQFIEMTVPHAKADSRGNRRWFTIASTPSDEVLRLGISVPQVEPSSFKTALMNLTPDTIIDGWQVAGDFTLPEDPHLPLTFMAGGIGVTPFRSMIASLVEQGERRDITLFHTSDQIDGFAYADTFAEAARKVGLRYVQVYTGRTAAPAQWTGEVGFIDSAMLSRHTSKLTDRHYYLSGPPPMVNAYNRLLRELSISEQRIKTDFFIGY